MATASSVVDISVRSTKPTSRVVFTQGGKGGVGKTAFSTLLVEWYASQGAPVALIDRDSENKDRGSLAHFSSAVRKVNIQRAADWTTLWMFSMRASPSWSLTRERRV
jgi:Mrp family chromosome partitioning ATPase